MNHERERIQPFLFIFFYFYISAFCEKNIVDLSFSKLAIGSCTQGTKPNLVKKRWYGRFSCSSDQY